MYKIVKRNGRLVEFDLTKIINAITKAFKGCNRDFNADIIDFLALKAVADAENKI